MSTGTADTMSTGTRVYAKGAVYNTPWRGACGSGEAQTWTFDDTNNTFTFIRQEDWSHESSSGECSGGSSTLTLEGTFTASVNDSDKTERVVCTVSSSKMESSGYSSPGDTNTGPDPKQGDKISGVISTQNGVLVKEFLYSGEDSYQKANSFGEQTGADGKPEFEKVWNEYYDVFGKRRTDGVEVFDVEGLDPASCGGQFQRVTSA